MKLNRINPFLFKNINELHGIIQTRDGLEVQIKGQKNLILTRQVSLPEAALCNLRNPLNLALSSSRDNSLLILLITFFAQLTEVMYELLYTWSITTGSAIYRQYHWVAQQ